MKFRIALLLIVLAAFARLIPHPPNFTPLAAIGLFGAAYLQRRWLIWMVPVLALFVSDLVLNNVVYSAFYDGFTWFTSGWVYLALALVILVGSLLLRTNVSPQRIIGSSLSASVLFFLVSNFGTWATTTLYPKSLAGLLACYTAGLPFFGNTLLGDLFFCGVMFGGYAWVLRSRTALVQN